MAISMQFIGAARHAGARSAACVACPPTRTNKELLRSFRHLAPKTRVFVVHGEENSTLKFADKLYDVGFETVDVPVKKEIFDLA